MKFINTEISLYFIISNGDIYAALAAFSPPKYANVHVCRMMNVRLYRDTNVEFLVYSTQLSYKLRGDFMQFYVPHLIVGFTSRNGGTFNSSKTSI